MANDQNNGGMTVEEAGRKGGKKRAEELGRDGYQELGHKGGQATAERYGPEFYSEIGREGGKAAHQKNPELARRAGLKGGQRVKELIEEGKQSEMENE